MRSPEGSLYLLDLDGLGVGDPIRDLASWAADALLASPSNGVDGALDALTAGYQEGPQSMPSNAIMLQHMAVAVCERAISSLRRLEADGLQTAQERLRLATELWRESQVAR